MANYIVTLHQHNGCYNFLCTDSFSSIAIKAINNYIADIEFLGDPDITEIGEDEFNLFTSKRMPVLIDGTIKKKNKDNKVDLDIIEDRIRNRAKGARIKNKNVYRVWERYNFCDIGSLSKRLRLTKSVTSNKISKFINGYE